MCVLLGILLEQSWQKHHITSLSVPSSCRATTRDTSTRRSPPRSASSTLTGMYVGTSSITKAVLTHFCIINSTSRNQINHVRTWQEQRQAGVGQHPAHDVRGGPRGTGRRNQGRYAILRNRTITCSPGRQPQHARVGVPQFRQGTAMASSVSFHTISQTPRVMSRLFSLTGSPQCGRS